MDVLRGTQIVSSTQTQTTCLSPDKFFELLIYLFIVALLMHIEWQRRAGGAIAGMSVDGRWSSILCTKSCTQLLRRCAPEAAGVMSCLLLAAAFRISANDGRPMDTQVWDSIKLRWPLLVTADTLLCMQAMLRLVVLLSAVLRGSIVQPINGWPAALLFGAALSRVALIMGTTVYMLDGPIGGMLPIACELAIVPLTAALGFSVLRHRMATCVLLLLASFWFAAQNHLTLSRNATTDSLFVLAHVLELLAALAYLFNSVLVGSGSGVSAAFVRMLMPVQQALAAYYFVEVFEAVPALVGAGYPFEMLAIGGTTQLGAYLCALVICVVEYIDDPDSDTPLPPHVQQLQQPEQPRPQGIC